VDIAIAALSEEYGSDLECFLLPEDPQGLKEKVAEGRKGAAVQVI
jgi:hypothetical protein